MPTTDPRTKAQELTAAYEVARAAIAADYKNQFAKSTRERANRRDYIDHCTREIKQLLASLDANRAEDAADWRGWIAPFERERQARLWECKRNYYRAVLAEPNVDCFPMGTELSDHTEG
jgi:hypothetical protein